MKTIRVIIAGLLLAIGMIGSTGIPVSANSSDNIQNTELTYLKGVYEQILKSDNPDQTFAQLPEKTQQALLEALSDVHNEVVVVENGTMPKAAGSWDQVIEVQGHSALGTVIYKFDQRIAWDGDDVYVTALRAHYSYAADAVWPWVYDASALTASENGGVGYTYFNRYSQGTFNMMVGGDIWDSANPWLSMEVHGNGTFSYSGYEG